MPESKFRSYIELTKPGITRLVLITTAIGYLLALTADIKFDLPIFLFTLIGTALTCGGSSVLNNYLEREYDACMLRTASRPIPRGDVEPAHALGFGLLLVIIGTVLLVTVVNLLTGFLALLTCFLYVLVYTPLKRITWLNTFIGAIPGALPPMGGVTAATGEINFIAWLLFSIMFFWQIPHFYSIAWMYKDDYKDAGYKMISTFDKTGSQTFIQAIIFSILLIFVSLIPIVLDNIGIIYLTAATLLGLYILSITTSVYFSRTLKATKALLHATIIYLPLLLVFLVFDNFI